VPPIRDDWRTQRQTISSIETGQYCPSALLAFQLAEALKKRVDELFFLEGDRP
jgi:putative transcriptional regulator